MAKSAKDYIESKDFVGAKIRFDNSNKGWREHWFNTCYAIAQEVKEWATKYIFDPISLTITEIVKTVKKVIPGAKVTPTESNVYLIKMFDNFGDYCFLKAGKANDINTRFKTLRHQLYKRDNVLISRVELLKSWTLPTEKLAEAFESIVHNCLCRLFAHIPNDRYEPVEVAPEVIAEIDRNYQLMTAFF